MRNRTAAHSYACAERYRADADCAWVEQGGLTLVVMVFVLVCGDFLQASASAVPPRRSTSRRLSGLLVVPGVRGRTCCHTSPRPSNSASACPRGVVQSTASSDTTCAVDVITAPACSIRRSAAASPVFVKEADASVTT